MAGAPIELPWPPGFARVPADDWVSQPLEELALKYDNVEHHGWYANLEPTVEELAATLRDGDVVVDYSGGTGILVARLLRRTPALAAGFVIVDASPKFLRLALHKTGADPRVAYRRIRYLRDRRRLELLDEVLGDALVARGVDAISSTNAIHLYTDLADTLASWARVLRPGAGAFVQSGNIRNPDAPAGSWIIDATVEEIHRAARAIVATDATFARFRPALDDAARMAAYDELRARYFLPVRPLAHYVDALTAAGLPVEQVRTRAIEARVDDWYEFLAAYHDGVLGWAGGAEKLEGRPPDPDAIADRLRLLRAAIDGVFAGQPTFEACWTYVTCRKPA
jgi:SAM-dependent methyltransferase